VTTTLKVGAGSSGGAYIKYLLSKAEDQGYKLDATARYYAGRGPEPQTQPLSLTDKLGQQLHHGDISYDDAVLELVRAGMDADPAVALHEDSLAALEERVARDLSEAVARVDFCEAGTSLNADNAELRPDIDPGLARRLEIDTSRPLTVREITHLLDNRTALGNDIEGKKKHSPHRSVAETFGLDPDKPPPSVEGIGHVLAGRRIDGTQPVDAQGKAIPDHVVESAIRKFKTALGVPATRDTTDAEIQKAADARIDVVSYRRQIAATAPPVGYVDIVWSADKSVSSAWALAPTDAEANIIRSWVREANAAQMVYLESRIGIARSGAGGRGPTEKATLAWVSTEHVDARPTVDVARLDAQGRAYSESRDVPVSKFDPQLHIHNPTLSSMLTESGRISAVNLDLLEGEIKVAGAIGHAALATAARRYGVSVSIGPHGEARLNDVPEWLRTFHSRRTIEGTQAAREYAEVNGQDWDKLTPEQQIKLLDKGVASKRRDKDAPEAGVSVTDRSVWIGEATEAGYWHRSVLRPDETAPELTQEQRIEVARAAALPLLDKAMQGRSVISEGDLREIAARGMITAGLGSDPEADIRAVLKTFRERGVVVNGERTNVIEMTTHGERGRIDRTVTTGASVALEETLLAEVRDAAADRSTALKPAAIDRAVDRFLAAHSKVDRNGGQWLAQREMIQRIGEGGRVSMSIGVAGSGKTSAVVGTLVDAWHEDGRTVYGMTVPWKSAAALRDAGLDQALAIDAFLRRVEKGQIKVDAKTVIVADEVSQIGVRHQVELLKLAARTGAQLVEIGDPRQCQAIETPGIDLMAKAIGDTNIPKILSTIRQRSERDREVATMFRDGQAADGIAALQEDGRFHLVAGDKNVTVRHTADLWRKLTDAGRDDPDHTVLVMTDTNAHALEIGKAIRANRRAVGEIGRDETTLKAMDPNSGETFNLPVATGDKLRLFTRVYDADAPKRSKHLGSNGDVIEVRQVLSDGLRIRNADSDEGRITWAAMKPWRAPKNDPVRVTMGMAVTVDSAQSMTRTAAIYTLPDGSRASTGYKGYTAMSRHQAEAHIVVSDAAERKAITQRQMLGAEQKPSQEDVVRNIAANLSRFAEKRYATAMLEKAIDVQRGAVRSFLSGSEAVHRNVQRTGVADISRYEATRLSEVIRRVQQHAQRQAQQVQQRLRQQPDRDYER
jgi:hypothetical protein